VKGEWFLPHPLGPPLLTRFHRRGGIKEREVKPLLNSPFTIYPDEVSQERGNQIKRGEASLELFIYNIY